MKLDRVLLIDDDNTSNHISKSAIDRLGLAEEIIVRTNGSKALIYLKEECMSMNKFPELILLDLKMPGMDGFEFLEEFELISKNLRHNIVVVILTSSRNADDMVRLRKLGNYYVMNKPLNKEKVIDIYHRYFRDRLTPVK